MHRGLVSLLGFAILSACSTQAPPHGLGTGSSALRGTPLDDLLPPVPARKVPLPSMLRYPPPSDRRIARLNTFQAPPMPPLDNAEGPRISLIGVGPIEMRPRYRWPGVWF